MLSPAGWRHGTSPVAAATADVEQHAPIGGVQFPGGLHWVSGSVPTKLHAVVHLIQLQGSRSVMVHVGVVPLSRPAADVMWVGAYPESGNLVSLPGGPAVSTSWGTLMRPARRNKPACHKGSVAHLFEAGSVHSHRSGAWPCCTAIRAWRRRWVFGPT